jgi:hypothetical protein
MDIRISPMTADQVLALGMPFITAALFGLTALFVVKPWKEPKVHHLTANLGSTAGVTVEDVAAEGLPAGTDRFDVFVSHSGSDPETLKPVFRWVETKNKPAAVATELLVGRLAIDALARAAVEQAIRERNAQRTGRQTRQREPRT